MPQKKNTPEQAAAAKVRAKAYAKAYREDPVNMAKAKAKRDTPEAKAAMRAYQQTPEYKAADKVRKATPEYKAVSVACQRKPEHKATKAAYQRSPKGKADLAASKAKRLATPEGRANVSKHTARRNAAKLERTVSWACLASISEIYAAAAKATVELGIKMEVDHVLPIRGIITDNCQVFMNTQWAALALPGRPHNVSGLHIHTNLQLLSKCDNISKLNRITQAEALGLPPQ